MWLYIIRLVRNSLKFLKSRHGEREEVAGATLSTPILPCVTLSLGELF